VRGRELLTLDGPGEVSGTVDFTADGRRLVRAGLEWFFRPVVQVWDGRPLEKARPPVKRLPRWGTRDNPRWNDRMPVPVPVPAPREPRGMPKEELKGPGKT
jgi:hypothetical protein